MSTNRIRQLKCSSGPFFSDSSRLPALSPLQPLLLDLVKQFLFHVSPLPTVIAVPIKCFACLPLATFALFLYHHQFLPLLDLPFLPCPLPLSPLPRLEQLAAQ